MINLAEEKLIGEKIEEFRNAKGLTRKELAKASGLSSVHLWSIETGETKNPGIETLKAIAEGLGVPAAVLLS